MTGLVCGCGCGVSLEGRRGNARYLDGTHRVRAHRAREPFRRKRAARLALLRGIKVARGCAHCGKSDPPDELHFHHVDPSTKTFAVGDSLHRSLAVILAEIAKCAVLCRDCHAAEHRRLRSLDVTLAGAPSGLREAA